MNILLWVLQILLALHTLMGALWKFSNSSQTADLSAIPHGVWLVMSVVEILCCFGLILPAFLESTSILVPVSAGFIALEMLCFCGLNIFSAAPNTGHVIYWLVVAVISAFVVYGRLVTP